MTDNDKLIILGSENLHIGELTRCGIAPVHAKAFIAMTNEQLTTGIAQAEARQNLTDLQRSMIKAAKLELELRD